MGGCIQHQQAGGVASGRVGMLACYRWRDGTFWSSSPRLTAICIKVLIDALVECLDVQERRRHDYLGVSFKWSGSVCPTATLLYNVLCNLSTTYMYTKTGTLA